jgi:flagellar biosynthesis GTPase FlhF
MLSLAGLDDRQIFDAFQATEEEKAEKILQEAREGKKPVRSFADILAAKRLIDEARQTNLAPEPLSLPKEILAEEISTIYEEPEENPATEILAAEIEAEIEAKELRKEDNGQFSLNIVLNEDQMAAKHMAFAGKSFVLTGAAGTGKTTAQRAVAEALLETINSLTQDIKATMRRVLANISLHLPLHSVLSLAELLRIFRKPFISLHFLQRDLSIT